MFFREHVLGGWAAWFLVSAVHYYAFKEASLLLYLLGLPLSLAFSVLPDVDTNKSKAFKFSRKLVSFNAGLLGVIAYYYFVGFEDLTDFLKGLFVGASALILTFILLNRLPLEHRKLVHTIRFGFLASALVFLSSYYAASLFEVNSVVFSFFLSLFAFSGFVSHLILDKQVVV